MTILIAILASLAAFAGGAIALRFRDKLHIFLGLSAGAVIGAALFDLIPEAIELGESVFHPEHMTAFVAVGFLTYLILDRAFSFHTHGDNHIDGHAVQSNTEESAAHMHRGSLGAASFCLHSFIDGLAIGLAFQASSAIGTIVAIAVVAHRFSDGINTVGVILKHRGHDRRAWGWLTAVALAPIVGAASTYLFTVENQTLAVILAVFAGFFLYIGASDLIPEGHHSHSKKLTTIMTVIGAALLYLIVHIAHA
ncbi:MAG: ZIP family metal transporter [Candidatus Pacebacteria bacterium]|nr:ZIP family metal transporter [Candidatus Paceibacterota bacterium]